jgi:hypothetical protein
MVDAIVHARPGDDLATDAGAAGQVDDCRLQAGMAAAERHRELAVGAGDVEQRVSVAGQRHRLRHLGRGEASDLVLAADVRAPVGVIGRFVVQLDVMTVADQVLETRPPLPVLGGVGKEIADVMIRARIEPAPGALAHLVATVGTPLDVAKRGDHVEQQLRGRGLQAEVLGELGRVARPLCQGGEDAGALGNLQRARDRHPEHRLADRRRQLVQHQPDPLEESVGGGRDSHRASDYPSAWPLNRPPRACCSPVRIDRG